MDFAADVLNYNAIIVGVSFFKSAASNSIQNCPFMKLIGGIKVQFWTMEEKQKDLQRFIKSQFNNENVFKLTPASYFLIEKLAFLVDFFIYST